MTQFQIGDTVKISSRPESRHHRVPAYVKGSIGTIESVLRKQGKPETLAYQRTVDRFVTVYRVRLRQTDLWNEYPGPSRDSLEIEIYEHWLEAITNISA